MQPGTKMERDTATPSTVADQERGLLSDWKEDDNTHDLHLHVPAKTKWRTWPIIVPTALLLAVALATVTFLRWPFYQTSVAEAQETSTIKTNDYILDPTWDHQAPPQRREYTWVIRDQVHNPDGIYRPMMLVNDQFPGPLIECNEGDTIVIRVDNQAINATSIHWHGIYQKGSPHMDGTVGVTQCPIAPGQQFTYEFIVSGQSGTYWWHAHQGVQSSDGVHGPLIVHGQDEMTLQRIPYDTDRVLLISDHYHDLSSALLWQYLKPDMENTEPVPVGGLVNGRSVRNCAQFPDRKCDNTTGDVGLPLIDLAPNQSHRLRLINVGAFAEFRVQLDEHELAVTEVDGTDVEPMIYHRINISPAQRYSVVVNTTIATTKSFWFRARMVLTCFTDPPDELDPDVLAIVRYDSATVRAPTSIDWEDKLSQECKDMNTTDLVPSLPVEAPAEPDAFFYLRSNFEIGRYRLARGFFNSSSFRANARSPSLHRAIDGLRGANTTFDSAVEDTAAFVNSVAFDDKTELVIQSTGVQVIDILVSNFDDGNHPLHLHGYKYFVLAQGHGYPPMSHVAAELNRTNLSPLYDTLDISNPLRRDTASVEAYGWMLIRLVADNPGIWALHCHISWHSEAGLLMQLLTRTDELAKLDVPAPNVQLCAASRLEAGMGPDDESYRELAT